MTKLFLIAFLASSAIALANDLEIQNWAQADQKKTVSLEHGTTWIPVQDSNKTILIFHGLHESPHLMRNWADFFSKRGFNVLNVRLDGHFEPGKNGLKKVQSEDWIATADKAYELVANVSSEVAVLGYSTGGTLSAYLALKHPDKVKNIFLISPAFSLSEQVFFSTLLMGPTGISSNELCRNQNSRLCKLVMASDPEFKMMIQNGLEISPQAGHEVQDLIQQVFEVKTFGDESRATYYTQILEKLDTLSATVTMANTESDVVINEKLNAQWIKDFKGKKSSLMFKKSDKIYHGLMNKNYETRFQKVDSIGYNKRISEIEELFDKALAGQ